MKSIDVTEFTFMILGKSNRNIEKVMEKLKELNIGGVDVKMGKLVEQKNVEFDYGGSYDTYMTDKCTFKGIKDKGSAIGRNVSKLKEITNVKR